MNLKQRILVILCQKITVSEIIIVPHLRKGVLRDVPGNA